MPKQNSSQSKSSVNSWDIQEDTNQSDFNEKGGVEVVIRHFVSKDCAGLSSPSESIGNLQNDDGK